MTIPHNNYTFYLAWVRWSSLVCPIAQQDLDDVNTTFLSCRVQSRTLVNIDSSFEEADRHHGMPIMSSEMYCSAAVLLCSS